MTRYLSTEQLWLIAREIGVDDIRDLGLLDSAANRPSAHLFGTQLYPTIHLKAAALLESISRNHALVDGNKRLAWVAVAVFYGLNELELRAPFDEAYDLVIEVCTGRRDYRSAADQLERWTNSL